MSDDALAQATKQAMKAARCRVQQYGTDEDPVWECRYHTHESRSPDECFEIARAVRIGFGAGRRAALNEAAELAQDEINRATGEQARIAPNEVGYYRAVGGVIAGFSIRDAIRSLASTPTEETDDE